MSTQIVIRKLGSAGESLILRNARLEISFCAPGVDSRETCASSQHMSGRSQREAAGKTIVVPEIGHPVAQLFGGPWAVLAQPREAEKESVRQAKGITARGSRSSGGVGGRSGDRRFPPLLALPPHCKRFCSLTLSTPGGGRPFLLPRLGLPCNLLLQLASLASPTLFTPFFHIFEQRPCISRKTTNYEVFQHLEFYNQLLKCWLWKINKYLYEHQNKQVFI